MKLDEFIQAMQSQPGPDSLCEGGHHYDRQANTIVEYLRGGDLDFDDEADTHGELEDWQREQFDLNRLIEEDELACLDDSTQRRFVRLPDSFEINEWRMMAGFSANVESDNHAAQLSEAIHGQGAFRRFKDAIHRLGLSEQWYAYRDERYRETALDFCKANNIPVEET